MGKQSKVSATIKASAELGLEEIVLRSPGNDRAASVEFLARLCPALAQLQRATGGHDAR